MNPNSLDVCLRRNQAATYLLFFWISSTRAATWPSMNSSFSFFLAWIFCSLQMRSTRTALSGASSVLALWSFCPWGKICTLSPLEASSDAYQPNQKKTVIAQKWLNIAKLNWIALQQNRRHHQYTVWLGNVSWCIGTCICYYNSRTLWFYLFHIHCYIPPYSRTKYNTIRKHHNMYTIKPPFYHSDYSQTMLNMWVWIQATCTGCSNNIKVKW